MASTMTARYVSSLAPSSMQPNPIDSALLNLSTLKRNASGYYADLDEKVSFQIRLSDPTLSVNDVSVEVENLGEPAEVNVYAFNHQEAEVSFIPHERVYHKVTVRYHGQTVNGCPFDVVISPELEPERLIPSLEVFTLSKSKQRQRGSDEVHRDYDVIRSAPGTIKLSTNGDTVMLDDQHEVYLDVSEAGEGKLSVEVSNGKRNLPIQTIANGNGYTIRILANCIGVYNVYVNWNGKFISDNPLKLVVRERGKVIVYGDGIIKTLVDHPASFIVDSREYGDGVLKVKVRGPTSRAKTSIAENPDGTHTVMYVPVEAGQHTISVFLSEQEIPGSPFVADVKEKKVKLSNAMSTVTTRNHESAHTTNPVVVTSTSANNRVSVSPDENKILVFGDGLSSVLQGQVTGFVIDPRNTAAGGDLTIQITGPNSFPKCSVQPNQDGTYTATYIPDEVGTFTIDIFWSGNRIKGSPFRAEATNPSKIVLCGKQENSDSIRFDVGRPNVIEFDTSNAGKGVLTAFVDGPVGQHMNVVIERGQRSSTITYNPPVEGEYKLHILWSGNHLPNSPYYIISENIRQIDLTKIHVTGLITEMVVNSTYEFVIDGSAMEYGVPSASMQGFSDNIPVQIIPQHGNVYRATSTPKQSGAYRLHIKWSGHGIPGSPFSVNVNEMVIPVVEEITRDSLQKSMGTKLPSTLRTGKAYSLTIDAYEAGGAKLGEMAVTCSGPTSSVPVQIRDNLNQTFDLMLTPSEVGSHLLNIKVNGSHIEGSPFSFDVNDANQVSCYGQGLAGGPLSTYDSSFQCDTRRAGAGQLKIRAHGPKGAFNVEMLPSLKNHRILNVKFHPSTKGVYTINVHWEDQDVPGSPFKIKLT